MVDPKRREFIRQTFNAVASGYDRDALRFFADSAQCMAEQLCLVGSEQVLDVATGTGAVALALAPRLAAGHVTGIDVADAMLAQAEKKAEQQGLKNIRFQTMDMAVLTLPVARFDCATAAFALFFVEDMVGCLQGIASRLKPGGRVIVSGFSEDSFAPMVDLFLARIDRYGVPVPPLNWKRLGSESLQHELMENAGLENVQVVRRDLSYWLPDAEAWWEILWYAGFRGLLDQLTQYELRRFREEHLAEIDALATAQGIPLPVEVLYAHGVLRADV